MKKILPLLFLFSILAAEISISGDARFRPRLDIKKNDDGKSTSDMYYLYRARLNLKADIGEGWFFSTKLSSNEIANMTKMGNNYASTYLEGPGNTNSSRPSVNFTELYFGYQNDRCGFWVGAFPIKNNPALDLHFYSNKLVDIPFILYNFSSVTGVGGFKTLFSQKINWFLSVDSNSTNKTEESINENTEITELSDAYTYGADTQLSFGPLSVVPRVLLSFGGNDKSNNNIGAVTFGGDIKLPKLAGISSSVSYHYSVDRSDDGYSGDHLRALATYSLKENGKVKFFYDLATKDNDSVSFMWLSYTYTCFKGDFGSVTISPTIRIQSGKEAGNCCYDDQYQRSKFELTTQINFK